MSVNILHNIIIRDMVTTKPPNNGYKEKILISLF